MSWDLGSLLEKVGLQPSAEHTKDGSREKGGEARARAGAGGVRLLSPSSLQGQPGPPLSLPLLPGASLLLFLPTRRAHPFLHRESSVKWSLLL